MMNPTTSAGQGQYNPYGGNPSGNAGSGQGGQSIANMQWRSGLTRDQRQELISKIYNELIRATGEPPGHNVWMKASSYEMKLFHESQDREAYLTKISRRLYLLSQRPTMMNTLYQHMQQMQQQHQNPGMLQHTPMSSMGMSGGAPQYQGFHGQITPSASMAMSQSGMNRMPQGTQQNTGTTPMGGALSTADHAKQYWAKHAELKAKYWDDCVMVYNSFRRYVEMGRPEDEQNKKLQNLLHYVHQVVTFLGEDYTKNPPKPISEIQKAEAYIKKIVLPYLTKLKSEKIKKAGATPSQPVNSQSTGYYGQQIPTTSANTYMHSANTYNTTSIPTSTSMTDFNMNFGMSGQQNQFQMSLGMDINANQPQSSSTGNTGTNPDDPQQLMTLVETLDC